MELISQKNKLMEAVQNAEMVLLGIGEEFVPLLPECNAGDPFRMYVMSSYYASIPEDDPVIRAYQELRQMIGGKPYFAVTLNTDDLIYRGGFERDSVVAPCGSMEKMQCEEHIVEAAQVREAVLSAKAEGGAAGIGKYARCPQCGKPLKFHIRAEEGYLEEGYLPQWQKYNRWLSCTLNHKLCILELGVDFRYPQVIRWPFEKVAYFNQKAIMFRVHSRLPQTTAELGARGISVKASPIELLNAE
ncbi:MAG: hypothetical protein Q4C59_05950 [Lachnospiraceae bacterium]|nr:hypothetical protein [Lachnospiraceae bacterium]